MATNVGIILYFSVLRTMKNQLIPVLLLLYISDLTTSTVINSEESSTLESALFNADRILSTEPTIFHYPRTTVVTKIESKRHVFEEEWPKKKKPVPTSPSLVDNAPEKPFVKHVSHRDVGGIPYPSSSPRYPPQIPSYAPPSRSGFFTPPLPPEYLNPFAGKPTLRGSNSESNSNNGRRPIPVPPLFKTPYEIPKERVPLPPPDFMVPETKPSGKKALNTPSRPNSHQTVDTAFKEITSSSSSNNIKQQQQQEIPRQANETDFDFVPILQYPSVSRILSGSSGRKHDIPDLGDRHSGPNSRHNHHNFEHMSKILPKPLPPETPKPPETLKPTVANRSEPATEPIVNETTTTPVETSIVEEQPEPETETDIHDSESQKVNDKNAFYLWVVAWDIHVYLIASLFTLLSIYAVYNLILMRFYKHLLSRPYYVSIHVIIALIGVLRSVYLFHDAYNMTHSYPEPISHLLLNITCPLITTTFAIMFLYLIKTTDVLLFNSSTLKHPLCLILMSLLHLALCVCLDVTSDFTFDVTGTKYLPLVCQCIYILFCVVLGGSYLYIYKTLANAASRKQVEMFGSLYATTSDMAKNRPAALCLAIRITLAVSMLILLMAVVQIYGIFGFPIGLNDPYPSSERLNQNMHRWIWWAYHFSVRVIEISICYLLTWAAMQRLHNEIDEKESQNSTTGFALFPCGPCRNVDENIDDIYPAVCNTNQAIHNYSLRTGKKVYDDSYPLNSMEEKSDSFSRKKQWHLNHPSNNYDEIGPGSEIIEIKDALTRKGLSSTLNRSDSDASQHLPAHVSYESIGYHSGTFQNRIGIDNGHFDHDSSSDHGSNLSKSSSKKMHRNHDRSSGNLKKSGTLMAFPASDRRRMTARDGVQTLREGRDRDRQSPNSMLVDENGFVRFRSLADAERMSAENSRRSKKKFNEEIRQ